MAREPNSTQRDGWVEALGLPHIFRVLELAVDPSKLAIGLMAIILTFIWGGLLDWAWKGV